MTIPNEPLEMTFNQQRLTVGELMLFDPRGFNIFDFAQFLVKYTNWTLEDVKDIEAGEFEQIAEQLQEAIAKANVPLATSAT